MFGTLQEQIARAKTDVSMGQTTQADLAAGFSQITTTDPSFQPLLNGIAADISTGNDLLANIAQTLGTTDELVRSLQAEFGSFQQDYALLEEADRRRVYQAYVRITQQNAEIEKAIQRLEMENTRQDRQGLYTAEQTYDLVRYYGVAWWAFCLLVAVFGILLFTRVPGLSWKIKVGIILLLFTYPVWMIWLEAALVFLWKQGRAWVYGVAARD